MNNKPGQEKKIKQNLTGERELSENQILPDESEASNEQKIQIREKKVSPLDPDFIIMFFFALASDFLDIFFDLLTTLVQVPVPKFIGLAVDAFTMLILTLWIYHRTKQIATTKRGMKVGMSILKRIVPAVLIEKGSAIGLGLTSWVGLLPSWTITVISTLFL